jgi:hypothetical protein
MLAKEHPRMVIDRLLDAISNQKWTELHELYAEDAVVEYPFALPKPMRLGGIPMRLYRSYKMSLSIGETFSKR